MRTPAQIRFGPSRNGDNSIGIVRGHQPARTYHTAHESTRKKEPLLAQSVLNSQNPRIQQGYPGDKAKERRKPRSMGKAESQSSAANSTSHNMPSSSACDVLKPLSKNGGFPSSGAVAAKARELQQGNAGSPSPGSSPASSNSDTASRSASSDSPVQKRSETVLPMGKREGEGVRTWRRMIVEYN